jgi:hypothetical protein
MTLSSRSSNKDEGDPLHEHPCSRYRRRIVAGVVLMIILTIALIFVTGLPDDLDEEV